MRGSKPSAESNAHFAQLMKSYGGAQTSLSKPEASQQAPMTDKLAKPSPPPAVARPPEGKTETQRQEQKLAQKKTSQSEDARPRATAVGQAQKGSAAATLKGESEKRQAAPSNISSSTTSPDAVEQAKHLKAKTSDSSEGSEVSDANAAAAIAAAQQASNGASLPDLAGAAAPNSSAGSNLEEQGKADSASRGVSLASQLATAGSANAHEFTNAAKAEQSEAPAYPGATSAIASPGRPSLHAQPNTPSATLQAKQIVAGLSAELTQHNARNFNLEMLSAPGNSANSSGEAQAPKVEGSGFEGLLAAAGVAAPSSAEIKSEVLASREVTLSHPLTEPGFAPEMAARLSVLAADGIQEARLHLNPAEMGPVSVQIIVEGHQAQIAFHAEHEQTRHVLEQSLPDLAAALRDSGLTLSGGGVFQQAEGQNRSSQNETDSKAAPGSDRLGKAQLSAVNESKPMLIRQSQGVVDLYA
ncbi:flagellar hook-length control protein FliK [Paucibacter oligotrophus]|uniref:Flagellar hook-length control protein FliK n=2 Tax=Roseateles oligotrophus TaxID=1769250 RepID=A0ABT2YAT6_9BURK|nr:flagellar hook-length control protein FliK [Roseateles oligotrophus]